MTTRRDVLTGLAAMPITAAAGDAAEASPATNNLPASVAATPAQRPSFLHGIDRDMFEEVEILERLLPLMKARLLNANDPNPMIRYGALFEMRCLLGSVVITMDWLRILAEGQRIEAHDARFAEETHREAEGRPHNAQFLAHHREKMSRA